MFLSTYASYSLQTDVESADTHWFSKSVPWTGRMLSRILTRHADLQVTRLVDCIRHKVPRVYEDGIMVNLAQLAILKEKLVQAKDFMPVLDYFMTHFGENPQFMNMGKRSRQPVVEAAVTETMQHLYGKAISPKRLLLTRLAQERFVHGGGMFENRVLTIFYFEEIQMGLLAIASPFTTDEIKVARFTGTVLSNN